MILYCPECNETVKEFEPTSFEIEYFSQEELSQKRAEAHYKCKECKKR